MSLYKGADLAGVQGRLKDILQTMDSQLRRTGQTNISSLTGLAADTFAQYPRTVAAKTNAGSGDTVTGTTTTKFATTYDLPNALLTDTTGSGRRGLRVKIGGAVTYNRNVIDTLRLRLLLGPTVLLDTGAVSFPALFVNKGWRFEADVIVVGTGSGGTAEASGVVRIATNLVDVANTAPVSLDLEQAATLAVDVTWSFSSASDSITLRTFVVDALSIP